MWTLILLYEGGFSVGQYRPEAAIQLALASNAETAHIYGDGKLHYTYRPATDSLEGNISPGMKAFWQDIETNGQQTRFF